MTKANGSVVAGGSITSQAIVVQAWKLSKAVTEQLEFEIEAGIWEKAKEVSANSAATVAEATFIQIIKKGKVKNYKQLLTAGWGNVTSSSKENGIDVRSLIHPLIVSEATSMALSK